MSMEQKLVVSRHGVGVMQNWMLPRITDDWDEQVQAIDGLSHVLDGVPPSQRDGQVALLRAAVARHVNALSDVELTRAAYCVADDLYKAADRLSYWDYPLELYLWASANAFFEAVRARGFMLSYVVDNSFEDLTRPVRFYPLWYKPTGLCYICPQHIAYSGEWGTLRRLAAATRPNSFESYSKLH